MHIPQDKWGKFLLGMSPWYQYHGLRKTSIILKSVMDLWFGLMFGMFLIALVVFVCCQGCDLAVVASGYKLTYKAVDFALYFFTPLPYAVLDWVWRLVAYAMVAKALFKDKTSLFFLIMRLAFMSIVITILTIPVTVLCFQIFTHPREVILLGIPSFFAVRAWLTCISFGLILAVRGVDENKIYPKARALFKEHWPYLFGFMMLLSIFFSLGELILKASSFVGYFVWTPLFFLRFAYNAFLIVSGYVLQLAYYQKVSGQA